MPPARRVFGAEHRDTLASCNNVAYAHALAGNFREAILLFLQTLVARTRVLGADHPDTLISLSSLADAYMKAGNSKGPLRCMSRQWLP
ncbi:tetratricopeptide repeat protein, partial [Streptomyces sp. L7]